MSFLTEKEGIEAAQKLLGPDGDCWFNTNASRYEVGIVSDTETSFLGFKRVVKTRKAIGYGDYIETALVDAAQQFERDSSRNSRRLQVAQYARKGQLLEIV